LTASVYSILLQASSGIEEIEEIAVLTLASKRTMTETSAPDLSAAAGAQRNDLPYGRAERRSSVRLPALAERLMSGRPRTTR
jgi:hypothetical protein